MPRAFIGIGSNIEAETNVRRAICLLNRETHLIALSTFYLTHPLGRPDQPEYYNGVAEIETERPAEELKDSVLRRIEDELGRERTNDRYAARTIDLDILLYGDPPEYSDPQIAERPFLAIPLCELAPDLLIPGSNRQIKEIAVSLMNNDMKPLFEFTERLRREMQVK